MKNKDKKLILNIITILAVAFSITQFFFPVHSISTYDFPEKYSRNSIKENYLLFNRYLLFDENDFLEKVDYNLLHIEAYQSKVAIDDVENLGQASYYILPSAILFLIIVFLISVFVYFVYKSIRLCGIKKTRFFLYSAITMIIIAIGFFIGTLSILKILSFDIRFIKLNFSFYYMTSAIILFLVAHVIQSRYIDYGKEKSKFEKKYEHE